MQFAAVLATVLAAANAFTLKSTTNDADTNGKFISPVHEGGGYSYLALNDKPWYFEYDENTKIVSFSGNNNLGTWPENNVAIGPSVTAKEVTFGYHSSLEFGEQLWACKHFAEPYGYSQHTYLVRYGDSKPNDDCIAMAIIKG